MSKQLTKAEEQIMKILWQLELCTVKEIIAELPVPKPAYNTVSTIVRILEDKNFVDHEPFGKGYKYYPIIKKEAYSNQSLHKLMWMAILEVLLKVWCLFLLRKTM